MTQDPGRPGGSWQAPGWSPPPGSPPPLPPAGGHPEPSAPADTAVGGPSGPTWHRLPPEELARLHQPGVVPLRPLTVGDVFGGALQTMRRNPGATVGTGFLVLALLLVPSYLASVAVLRAAALPVEDRWLLAALVSIVFSTLASVALTGMIVHVVGEAVLGDRAGLADTWRAVRGRMPALLGTLLLLSVLLVGLLVVVVLGTVLLAWLASRAGEVAAVLVVVAAVVLTVLLLVWVGIRLSLAPAVVVLEKVGPWRGLRRAWQLTTGLQGWRVVGIVVLASIVTGIFSSAVQVPVTMAVSAMTGLDAFSDEGLLSPVLVGADHLVQLVVGAFVTPFTAGVTALLYLDQRIRREGLDGALVQAAQARAAGRAR